MRTMHAPDETRLPNSACDLASARRTLGVTAVEYGSGADRDESGARAAAIGEALERYCGMYVPPERVRVATARALGDAAVDPARFGLFRDDQLARPGFPFAPFTLRHPNDVRGGRVARGRVVGAAPGRGRLPRARRTRASADRVLDHEWARVRPDPRRGLPGRAARARRARRGHAGLEQPALAPVARVVRRPGSRRPGARLLRAHGPAVQRPRRMRLPGRPGGDLDPPRAARVARRARDGRRLCVDHPTCVAEGPLRELRGLSLARDGARERPRGAAPVGSRGEDLRPAHAVLRGRGAGAPRSRSSMPPRPGRRSGTSAHSRARLLASRSRQSSGASPATASRRTPWTSRPRTSRRSGSTSPA